MKMKRIERISKECANGNFKELILNCDVLKEDESFEDYFLINNYNAYAIDKAVSGNALYFTLMYVTYKLDWKNLIPKFNERSFRNLAYQLQLSYRNNPYHN